MTQGFRRRSYGHGRWAHTGRWVQGFGRWACAVRLVSYGGFWMEDWNGALGREGCGYSKTQIGDWSWVLYDKSLRRLVHGVLGDVHRGSGKCFKRSILGDSFYCACSFADDDDVECDDDDEHVVDMAISLVQTNIILVPSSCSCVCVWV
jgi:hypothetical protein